MMQLRDYQSATIARVEASLHRRIMIQSPTGSGKYATVAGLYSHGGCQPAQSAGGR